MSDSLTTTAVAVVPMTETEARQCVDDIRQGIVGVRQKLLELYEREGWRVLGYGSWRECAQAEFGYSQAYAYRLLGWAEVERRVSPIGEMPVNEAQARPLARLDPEAQREAWGRVLDNAQGGRVTAAGVQAVVDEMTAPEPEEDSIAGRSCASATIAVPARVPQLHIADDSYEWYTPAEYIEAARAVMGSIDLDPASCASANEVVKAGAFYDAQVDGLRQAWRGNVWLNPPYNMPWIEDFVNKALAAYGSGACPQVMILTNNSTDTGWFHKLMAAGPFCLTRGRIHFWGESGEVLATRQGQAIFYLGPNADRFTSLFGNFGTIVEAIGVDSQQGSVFC